MSKASERQDRGAGPPKARLDPAKASDAVGSKPSSPAGERQPRAVRRILGDYSEQTGAHFG